MHEPLALVTFHYSCGISNGDPKLNPVSYIEVLPDGRPVERFDAWEDGEETAIENFARYVEGNQSATWLGWRCLRSEYGFPHLRARYTHLTGKTLVYPQEIKDLKDLLKNTHGEKFAAHPRLETAASNNGVTTNGLLTAEQAAAAFQEKDYASLRRNTGRRCAIIRDLYLIEQRGSFKTETDAKIPGPASKPRKRAATVDRRMQAMLATNLHEVSGWTAKRWAQELGCAKSTVAESKTWKELSLLRLQARAEQRKDRRRKDRPIK